MKNKRVSFWNRLAAILAVGSVVFLMVACTRNADTTALPSSDGSELALGTPQPPATNAPAASQVPTIAPATGGGNVAPTAVQPPATPVPQPAATQEVNPLNTAVPADDESPVMVAAGILPQTGILPPLGLQLTGKVFPSLKKISQAINYVPTWPDPSHTIPFEGDCPKVNGLAVWCEFILEAGQVALYDGMGINTPAGHMEYGPGGGWVQNDSGSPIIVQIRYGELIVIETNDPDGMAQELLKAVTSGNRTVADYLGKMTIPAGVATPNPRRTPSMNVPAGIKLSGKAFPKSADLKPDSALAFSVAKSLAAPDLLIIKRGDCPKLNGQAVWCLFPLRPRDQVIYYGKGVNTEGGHFEGCSVGSLTNTTSIDQVVSFFDGVVLVIKTTRLYDIAVSFAGNPMMLNVTPCGTAAYLGNIPLK